MAELRRSWVIWALAESDNDYHVRYIGNAFNLPLLANSGANLWILEASKEVREHLGIAPENIVVNQSEDLALGFLDSDSKLVALICVISCHEADAVSAFTNHGLDKIMDTLEVAFDGDDDDFARIIGEPKAKGIRERVRGVNGRDDDADICALVVRRLGNRKRLVRLGKARGERLIVGEPCPEMCK